jgi:hypothetical protein
MALLGDKLFLADRRTQSRETRHDETISAARLQL